MRTIGFTFGVGILAIALTVQASPIVNLDHYYVAENSLATITLGVSDSSNVAAEDIEGMTFTLQVAAGAGSTPSISSVDLSTNTIWSAHSPLVGVNIAEPQFQSFTVLTGNEGDFVNPNGTLATIAFSAAGSAPGDYPLKLVGTKESGSDSNFNNGIGNLVPATFGNGTLTVLAPGDFNRDTHVDATDLLPMMQALANPSVYEAAHGNLTDAQLRILGDINGDSQFNNADVQALVKLLQAGGGSTDPVPEPSTFVLAALAFGMLGWRFRYIAWAKSSRAWLLALC